MEGSRLVIPSDVIRLTVGLSALREVITAQRDALLPHADASEYATGCVEAYESVLRLLDSPAVRGTRLV